MHICILGSTEPDSRSDSLAEAIACQLCEKISGEPPRAKARHQLIVTASPNGTAEAVRRGASLAPVRRVNTHSLGPPHPNVIRDRNPNNGYFIREYATALDRLHHLEAAPMLIFLALNRRNAGLLLNTLYALGEELQNVQGLQTVPRKILLWVDALAMPGNPKPWSFESLQYHLGHNVNEEDHRKIIIFETPEQVVEHVEGFSAQIENAYGIKASMEQSV